jgi:hypothetical protein
MLHAAAHPCLKCISSCWGKTWHITHFLQDYLGSQESQFLLTRHGVNRDDRPAQSQAYRAAQEAELAIVRACPAHMQWPQATPFHVNRQQINFGPDDASAHI